MWALGFGALAAFTLGGRRMGALERPGALPAAIDFDMFTAQEGRSDLTLSPDQSASLVPKLILGRSAALNGKLRSQFEVLGEDIKHESRQVCHLLRRWIEVE